ncbi:MAG: hypothetical protein KC657_04175 [Myxococcales bacterium]|nr:hypothetical protein [Myxococcales bacterium]
MHASKKKSLRLAALACGAAVVASMGCELIVDFDRTRIPVEGTDTGIPPEASLPEGSTLEASTDAPAEAAADAGTDASNDAADASDDAPDAD